MDLTKSLINEANKYVINLLTYHLSEHICYHTLEHTLTVLRAVRTISAKTDLTKKDILILELAALFHDTGFLSSSKDHERISCLIARNYLRRNDVPQKIISDVCNCIMATKENREPKNSMEEVIRDADMFHLSLDNYWTLNSLLRKEMDYTLELSFTDAEWYKNNSMFLEALSFYTIYGKEVLALSKLKLIRDNQLLLESIIQGKNQIIEEVPILFPSWGQKEIVKLKSGCHIAV